MCTRATVHVRAEGSRVAWAPVASLSDVIKRVVFGRALHSNQLGETLLPKRIALPVFASDALSSNG